jgi:hypothetical protein
MKPESSLQIGGFQPAAPAAEDSADVIRSIAAAIRGVRFGSVEVVIEDSRVVPIERKT